VASEKGLAESEALGLNSAAFCREGFKDSLLRSISFESGSLTTAKRLLKSYLARNSGVAANLDAGRRQSNLVEHDRFIAPQEMA